MTSLATGSSSLRAGLDSGAIRVRAHPTQPPLALCTGAPPGTAGLKDKGSSLLASVPTA